MFDYKFDFFLFYFKIHLDAFKIAYLWCTGTKPPRSRIFCNKGVPFHFLLITTAFGKT